MHLDRMLRTDRIALDAEIQHARLNIQERDLNNVVTFLDGLATQSALLAGFAFVAFTTYDDKVAHWKIVLLYLSTCVSLGANLFVLVVGQLVTIYGPTLALKGPSGSMERAVNLMRYYRSLCFWMFAIGIIAFSLMILCLVVIYLPDELWGLSVPCLIIMILFFVFTFFFSVKILQEFSFKTPDLQYVIGKNLRVPGLQGSSSGCDDDTISAAKFLGIDGKVNGEAGKF